MQWDVYYCEFDSLIHLHWSQHYRWCWHWRIWNRLILHEHAHIRARLIKLVAIDRRTIRHTHTQTVAYIVEAYVVCVCMLHAQPPGIVITVSYRLHCFAGSVCNKYVSTVPLRFYYSNSFPIRLVAEGIYR